jgi:hypothetical protein
MKNGDFGRALVISSDLKGYGQGNDKRQEAMQDGFVALHEAAAEIAGLRRHEWAKQPGGDGELAVLPPGEPEPRVVDDYVRALHQGLATHNAGRPHADRLRLRVAIAFGNAYAAANGFAGQAVVEVSRLVAWEPLKSVFKECDQADLVVILSERVFEDTVRQGHTSFRVADFRAVTVHEKGFCCTAWVWVPGADVAALKCLASSADNSTSDNSTLPSPADSNEMKMSQQAQAITNMYGPVDARGAVFGVSGS